MIRRLALSVLGAVALCLAVTPTSGAIGPFGVAHTVLAPSCHPDAINGDLVQDTGGRSRGFVNLYGSTCNPSQVITYVSGVNGAWSRQTTPYRGFPVATAWDSTGSFLLYVSYPSLKLYVTKRYADGTFAAPRLLSSNVGPDGSLLTGDIVAAHGQWWAVWREHVAANGSAGDEFAQTDLFQAYTFGGSFHGRGRITGNPAWDGAPALALTPGAGLPVRMVWTRGGSDFGGSAGTDVWMANATTPGQWTAAPFATAGSNNFWPDIAVAGSSTYVTWNRDGHILVASRVGSVTTTRTFATPGLQHRRPRIAAFGPVVAVGWTSSSYRSYVAELVGKTWTGRYAGQPTPTVQHLFGVATTGGRSTAITMVDGSGLFSTTES